MRFERILVCMLALLCVASEAPGQRKGGNRAYPPVLKGAKVETYKTVGDVKLNLYMYFPEGHKPTDKRPAIVFFFGGGWKNGSPSQFEEHCKHLSSRGMVAISVDYRVASRHQVKAVRCVSDAKSAVRFIRKDASRLGIDPDKIVASGGSAGGHIAACTGVVPRFDESSDDASISSVPNAMVLFNPALVLAPIEELSQPDKDRVTSLRDRMGTEPRALSPYHNVRAGAPSTIIFHGKSDSTVPYATAEAFARAMTAAGNTCTLIGYDDQSHGFFNHGRGNNEYYAKTVRAMEDFLIKLGYLRRKT